MADAGLHEKAKLALKKALDGLLVRLTVRGGWPDLNFGQYQAITATATALARYEPWRSHVGFFEFYQLLSDILRRYELQSPEDESISLSKALGNKFEAYSAEVWDFLLSLPRAYLVKVDLPAMPQWGPGTISLTNRMTLVEDAPPAEKPGDGKTNLAMVAAALVGSSREPPSRVRLEVRSSGYGNRRLETTAVQDAISHIKQFSELFRNSSLFKQTTPGLLELLGGPKPLRFKIVDLARPDEIMEADVPDRLARFLASMSIHEAKLLTHESGKGFSLLGGGMREATTREERAEAFVGAISDIRELMDCPPDWPDIHNIKTALEWSFDSRENDNQTLSFIQACIGLEALLGEATDKEEPLTATLADRCAYLLGQNHGDRTRIRGRFKEMYRVRSKLVHGRSPKLDIYDVEQLSFAQTTLEEIAREEGRRLRRALRKAGITGKRSP
jgi:hypothetical protein